MRAYLRSISTLAVVMLMSPSSARASEDGSDCLIGMVEHGDVPARPSEWHAGPQRVFLNFEGANLVAGEEDDAPNNVTQLRVTGFQVAGPFPAYGDGAKKDAVYQAVVASFADIPEVEITRERPASGPYTMVMIGPHALSAMGRGVAAYTDCGNAHPSNLTFGFFSDSDEYNATQQAKSIAHELGHSFGLEHTRPPNDIMVQGGDDPNPVFMDACVDGVPNWMYGERELNCVTQHQSSCQSTLHQNAVAEMRAAFSGSGGGSGSGGTGPDVEPPQVVFTAPQDGGVVPVGSPFVVAADVTDDGVVDKAVLRVDGVLRGTVVVPPYEWNVTFDAPGTYELSIEATDGSGMTHSAAIEVTASNDAPSTDDGTGGVGTGIDDGTDGSLATGGTGTGLDGEGAGCGCAGTRPPLAMMGWPLAFVLVARRRPV